MSSLRPGQEAQGSCQKDEPLPLKSLWFSSNDRLQRCLVSDADHVKRGDQGMHVLLIQEALMMLDNSRIHSVELINQQYGKSTASATLAYKRRRNIVSRSYQSTADDIVGKMTIESLDREMRIKVGHGGDGDATFSNEEGFFDLGPHGSFRVAGRNAVLPGDPPPKHRPSHGPPPKPAHVSAFYDFRPPNPILKGGYDESRKDHDEASTTNSAKVRLSNWGHYADIAKTFQTIGLSGVILLTCKVAGASGFLKRVRQQWGTPIIGYPRRVVGQPQANGRTRIFLEGDAPESGPRTAC